MRILFTPLASPSHVLPMVALAWAFRSAGHEVRFAAQPRVAPTVVRSGLQVTVVGDEHDMIEETNAYLRANPHLLRPNGRLVILDGAPAGRFALPWIRSAESVAPDLVAFAKWWRPDAVVTDPMFYAGPLVAEVLGVPLIRNLFGPDWTKAGLGMGGFVEADGEPEWPQEMTDFYRSYGVRCAADYAVCTVDAFPPSLQVPGLTNRVTMRQVPFNGGGAVPAWVRVPSDRPRVCVTGGTANTEILGPEAFHVPTIIDALAALDVETVVAISAADRDLLGSLPSNARVVENVPLDTLLPTCAAIVSHGGAGTTSSAATHGVPQVIIPMLGDQHANARLVVAAGIGVQLDGLGRLDPAGVTAAVSAMIEEPGPRSAARRVREEIAALPAPAEVVGVLERIIASA